MLYGVIGTIHQNIYSFLEVVFMLQSIAVVAAAVSTFRHSVILLKSVYKHFLQLLK